LAKSLIVLSLIFALTPLATPAHAIDPLVELGQQIFDNETFDGNGRTCRTCHDANQAYSITSDGIATLFASNPLDPLFINENDPALATLENSCLLRGGDFRALMLENPDGFGSPPVFRNAPHLLNVGLTAPYGQTGDVPLLRDFVEPAIVQHATKTMARVAGVDFRVPTSGELDALEAYMNSISFPTDGNFDLDRMINYAIELGADAAAIQRGRDLFFDGSAGAPQCFRCHSGPTLSDADGSLGTGTGNLNFNTGVVNVQANQDDNCEGGPGDPTKPLPAEDGGNREFNTPSLLGIAAIAPFFHDGSAGTLLDAVKFYSSFTFFNSPAGLLMPTDAAFTNVDASDITAFLEALSVDPSPAVAVPSLSPWSISLLVVLLLAIPSLTGILGRCFSTR
jgi:cytochrome c peroxidase